ncbi:MAG: low molecular weight protein arginine phosphatase [Anaerolineae bacterium]|nr:MAG: low molecular weight protein arginine phosphatase [Anaerolineae bacterium]
MAVILIVCTANICRSPVVRALLEDRLAAYGLEDWTVKSAGTWAYEGQKAADFSVLIMAEQGLDINNHQSQPINKELMAEADLILTLEIGHSEALAAEFPDDAFKVHPLTEMAGEIYSVEDPFGGTREDYERMVVEVTRLVEDGLAKIVELATHNAENRTKAVNI